MIVRIKITNINQTMMLRRYKTKMVMPDTKNPAFSGVFLVQGLIYIMPGIPPIPPISGIAGAAALSSLISETIASVVIIKPATEPAA